MLTPKMSLRRNNVLGAYKSVIEQLYERPNDCTTSGVIQVRARSMCVVQMDDLELKLFRVQTL